MYQIYQIAPNDTIVSIAGKFNTAIDEIRKINGMVLNTMLVPGNYIVVPNSGNDIYTRYVVVKGDNLYSIAQKNGTTVQSLVAINGLEENAFIYPNQEILIPRSDIGVYVTVEDDTLNGISDKSGVPVEDIIRENQRLYLLPDQIIVYKKRENI